MDLPAEYIAISTGQPAVQGTIVKGTQLDLWKQTCPQLSSAEPSARPWGALPSFSVLCPSTSSKELSIFPKETQIKNIKEQPARTYVQHRTHSIICINLWEKNLKSECMYMSNNYFCSTQHNWPLTLAIPNRNYNTVSQLHSKFFKSNFLNKLNTSQA